MLTRRFLLLLVLALPLLAVPPGLRAQRADVLRPTVFAIVDARVVPQAGTVLPKATVVVRDGLIEAVAADAKAPADALVIDGKGLTVYPGFLDGLSHRGFDPALRRSEMGAPAPEDYASGALAATKPDNRKGMTPEFQVSTALKAEDDQADVWRRAGFTAHLVAPEGGLFAGQSALVSASGAPPREAVLRTPVALHAAFRSTGPDYPRVLMGFIAHCRQTLLDAGHYQRAWQAYEQAGRVGRRPPLDPALADLGPALAGTLPVVFEADARDEIHRALDFAQEFHLKPVIYGGRDAWKVADRLKAMNVPVVLRLNFTTQPAGRGGRRRGFAAPAPGTPTPGQQPGTPGTQGRRRGQQQAEPAVPPAGGPPAEPEQEQDLPQRVKDDQQRQLKEEMHNAAVLHDKGVLFAFSSEGITGDRPADKFRENLRKAITEGGLSADAALRALTSDAARVLGVERQLGTLAPGKAAHLVVTDGDFQAANTQVRYLFSDGVRFEYEKTPAPAQTAAAGETRRGPGEGRGGPREAGRGRPEQTAQRPDAAKPAEKQKPKAEYATEIEADRKPKLHTDGNVLVKGATVLTVTHGTLPDTDVLVTNGKIAAVGKGLQAPAGTTVVPAEGQYLLPGIIDTHSHFAVAGGVNEFSLSIVPEVRVRDVVDGEDVQIYRALAGGVTTARLLHGSANVIGGQDAVIKLKYGRPAGELIVTDAPRGVKFALGENVKRTDGRFPNTRLGVEALLVRAFSEAQAYRRQWQDYQRAKAAGKATAEPRRDLRLEALADILAGDLKVHCHCYRADEILMLLRVADRFGFKVQSLQHVLEGYKIAPEIAAHGASCSTFSDWWAYKLEAYDAIPYNSALLNEAGVTVCIKSDSNELMRHLYQEAAKCVKYGGMSETDALKTITLNAARQLGLEGRLGSIDVGKDGDLALFSAHPLDSYARPVLTVVDGEVYFQRPEVGGQKPEGQKLAAAFHVVPDDGKLPSIPRDANGVYVVRGVTAHPVAGAPIAHATVVVRGGRIAAVEGDNGAAKSAAAEGATVVDGTGLHLYPGMIDAATVLGLTELGSARETQDFAEGGDFQPDLRASIAINPDSELIPVTRANGVLAVVTRPTGSIIAGQSALINLAGWVPREMTVVDPLALHVEFPAPFPSFGGDPTLPMVGRALARRQREEKVRRLKELFRQAVAYDNARKQAPEGPVNPRLEALVPYARGSRPVVIQAQRRQEILDALALADELKLKMILSGAVDAWKVAGELKKRDIPVIVGPTMALPQENYDPYDAPYDCPARLHEAGVRFCIRSAGTTNTRNLPYEAAMAVSCGLPAEEGLKAVTLYPAQILGVADQLGTLEAGKRANLVLTTGDILQASTVVKALFIDGQPLQPTSKHTRLYERYRERLRQVKEGKAPLGTR
jgi:imidazolonepropionase-like amidohydrolase